jgi:hypothetical protein
VVREDCDLARHLSPSVCCTCTASERVASDLRHRLHALCSGARREVPEGFPVLADTISHKFWSDAPSVLQRAALRFSMWSRLATFSDRPFTFQVVPQSKRRLNGEGIDRA